MTFEHEKFPSVTTVQVAADSQAVTVAYLNHLGNALEVREFSVRENPELSQIVTFTYFDDIWDMDMVLALLDEVSPEEVCPPLETLVPAYLQSLQAAV
jgi:hypothetical protein